LAEEIIRASEVGQYVYCARAWWLQHVRGYQPQDRRALEAGIERHWEHGRLVAGYHRLQLLGYLLLLLALLIAIALLCSLSPQ
jgi:hypothetical protein